MFLIAIDMSGRLLIGQRFPNRGSYSRALACLPNIDDSSSKDAICEWLAKIGISGVSNIALFDLNLSTGCVPSKFAICNFADLSPLKSKFELKSLDLIWHQDIDDSIVVSLNKILKQVETNLTGAAGQLESRFLREFVLSKVSQRVYFAQSETVEINQALISFLGAFAVVNGQQTARLCMHQDQKQKVQEMLMIHTEPISTGPLRQNNDSSVSYHMVRGALEITLHHGGEVGDKVHEIEYSQDQPSMTSSLRVPAKVFRTIRTLTDSAVFIEVQSGPFSDSDTEWQL